MKDILADLPGYALRRASSAMLAEFAAKLAPLDLRPTEASTLVLIAENAGITSSALCQFLGMQRANMVPLVARLEQLGWVERVALDGRSIGLNVTNKGQKKCTEVRQIMERFEQRLIARIPEEHREHFVPALRALWHS